MAASKVIIRREPISVRIIKTLMYLVVGVGFTTFLREPVWNMLRNQPEIFQNDLTVNLISLSLGFIVAYLIMFLIKRRSRII